MARLALLFSLVTTVIVPFGQCIPCGGPVSATPTVVPKFDAESGPRPTLALQLDEEGRSIIDSEELKRRSFCYPNVYDPSCTPLIPTALSISFPPYPTISPASISIPDLVPTAYPTPVPAYTPTPSNPFVVPKSSSSSDGVNWSVPTPNPDPEEFSSSTSDSSRVKTGRQFPKAAIAGIAVGAAAVIAFFSTVCCCCFRKKNQNNQPQAAGLLETKNVEPLPSPSPYTSPYPTQTPHSYDQASAQGYPFPQTSPPMSNSPMAVQQPAPYSPLGVTHPVAQTPESYQQQQPLLQQQAQYFYQPPASSPPLHAVSPSVVSAQSPYRTSTPSLRPYEGT